MSECVDIFKFASGDFNLNESFKIEEQKYPNQDYDILYSHKNKGFKKIIMLTDSIKDEGIVVAEVDCLHRKGYIDYRINIVKRANKKRINLLIHLKNLNTFLESNILCKKAGYYSSSDDKDDSWNNPYRNKLEISTCFKDN